MAIQRLTLVTNNPVRKPVQGAPAPEPNPFRLYLLGVDADQQTADLRLSRYSALLASTNVKDRVPLIGVDLKLTIKYSEKIWLETYYDKNLVPVFSMVRTGAHWPAKVLDASGKLNEVYPDELEFITKKDLDTKGEELTDTLKTVNVFLETAKIELQYEKDTGKISAEQYASALTATTEAYQKVIDSINDYKNNMSQFFDSAPNALWRKLFRGYTLLAYTTHDVNPDLEGVLAYPPAPPVPPASGTPTATNEKNYRIVQCVNSDLLLVDICHQNRYPAKLAIPYHRPVYLYLEAGQEEDLNS